MLPPFQKADLPPKDRTFWQLVGPGAIMVGLSIGSGELIDRGISTIYRVVFH